MSAVYGRAALQRLREKQAHEAADDRPRSALDEVPVDAEIECPDEALHAWDAEKQRWVPWRKWLATTPIAREDAPPPPSGFPPETECVAGLGGERRIWLARDGDRWLMYAGSVRPANRRRDFASPCLRHAMQTAEEWYGAAADGWRAENRSHGKRKTPAGLPAEDSTNEDGRGKGGHDGVGLDGSEPDRR
jgi:hypothetical protein